MSDWIDPWHTLTITVKHFHDRKDCPGHDTPELWGVSTEPDIVAKDLVHPEGCKDLRTAEFDYRCGTEYDVMEQWWELDGPTESGTYRVRSSGWGPDYEGDYDAHTDFELVEAAA